MKIISRGKPLQERVFQVTCFDCKSVLEVSGEELVKAETGYFLRPYNYYVDCLVCGAEIGVNT